MADAHIESLEHLSRQRTSATVVDGCRHHDGNHFAPTFAQQRDGIERSLCVQGIEASFEQQNVGTPVEERLSLFAIRRGHLVKIDGAFGRLVHVRHQSQRLGGRSHRTSHPNLLSLHLVGHLTGNASTGKGHVACHVLALVLMLADAVRRERVGGDDVGTRLDIEAMDGLNDFGSSEAKHIVVAHERHWPRGKGATMKMFVTHTHCLDACTHGTIQNQYALL